MFEKNIFFIAPDTGMMTVQMEEDNHTVWNELRAQFQTGQTDKPEKLQFTWNTRRRGKNREDNTWAGQEAGSASAPKDFTSNQAVFALHLLTIFEHVAKCKQIWQTDRYLKRLFFKISTGWA